MFKRLELNTEEQKSDILDLSQQFKDSIIDLTKEVDRPPNAITIGVDDRSYNGVFYPLRFATFGNISMITGEEKSRKSFLKSLIEACAIGGKSNNYTGDVDIRGHNLTDKYIISIDAEQDTYDAWLNGVRVPKMVGAMHPKYIMLKWREKSKDERIALLDWFFMESPYKDELGLVIMDGFVDFVKDFNDLKECDEFASKLMRYSSLTQCHIMGILHLNPNSEKARGHLGTIIGQKCETVLIIKNMGDYSTVKRKVGRGKKFEDFAIRVDDDWLPYISDDDTNNKEITLK
jgi:hypothetical protein